MKKIIIHCHRSLFPWYDPRSITAGLIRLIINSEFNHIKVETVDGDTRFIYQAKMFLGVIKHREHLTLPDKSIEIPLNQTSIANDRFQDVCDYLDSKVGKRYDYLAIIGFLTAFRLQSEDALFCSEIGNNVLDILFKCKLNIKTLIAPKDILIRIISYLQGKNDSVVSSVDI
tara:strand:+ start:1453 stop:1968 length:516 start_codon:yes stop_codon:yes gene_type:complete